LHSDLIAMGSCSRMVALVGAAMSIISCTSSRPDLPRRLEQIAYLRDRLSRRSALVASLVDPDNGYSRLRLERYATGGPADWDRLVAWNPPVVPLHTADLDGGETPQRIEVAQALVFSDEVTLPSDADLHALGEAAFFNYPVQLAPARRLNSSSAIRYGLWVDDRGVGGLVRAQMADGSWRLAFTCATCHADVVGGRLIAGLPNGRLDLGRMIADSNAAKGVPLTASKNQLAWGPGRVDVTTRDGSLPERQADLRPLRWVSHLQYDATVRQRNVIDLAIRIETLIITSEEQAVRPPRVIALALASYIWDLGRELPPLQSDNPGAGLFAEHCSVCHAGIGLTGPPQPLKVVGTDPALGRSPDRGTGYYRVPSLRGVALRSTLLHDGSLPGLPSLLDPTRLDNGYKGGAHGPGPVPGHIFGLDLPTADRQSLLGYLEAL
jgi:hypothetical protein